MAGRGEAAGGFCACAVFRFKQACAGGRKIDRRMAEVAGTAESQCAPPPPQHPTEEIGENSFGKYLVRKTPAMSTGRSARYLIPRPHFMLRQNIDALLDPCPHPGDRRRSHPRQTTHGTPLSCPTPTYHSTRYNARAEGLARNRKAVARHPSSALLGRGLFRSQASLSRWPQMQLRFGDHTTQKTPRE